MLESDIQMQKHLVVQLRLTVLTNDEYKLPTQDAPQQNKGSQNEDDYED